MPDVAQVTHPAAFDGHPVEADHEAIIPYE